MKALLFGRTHKGASTLEILIACAVLTLVLSASAMVVYGNQYAVLTAQTAEVALAQARSGLEDAYALARSDMQLVVATTSMVQLGSVTYTRALTVSQVDLFIKQATSTVSWFESGRVHSVQLSTLLANPKDVLGSNTCGSIVAGDWSAPQITSPQLFGPSAGGNPVTGMVAFNKKLYVSTSDTLGHNHDLYIFTLDADPVHPTLLGSIDTNTTTPGLNAVAIASTSSGVYAFVANAHASNWSTCTPGPSCAQVQVLQVTNPASPVVVKNSKAPSATTPFVLGSGGQAIGNAVTYKDGYLYVGLTKTLSGPEFLVYDVGAGVGSPLTPIYVGSYAVGRGINSITVAHGFAYLATSDSAREMLVLDIHTPTSPVAVGVFNAPGSVNFGGGYTSALVGTTLYFGRNYVGNAPELYVLDVVNPATTPPVLSALDVGTAVLPESVNGIVVRNNLLFMVSTSFIKLFALDASHNLTPMMSFDVSHSEEASVASASACEGNYVYAGGYTKENDRGVLFVVYPGL